METERRSFLGATRPSEVLVAMCDGLQEAVLRDDFWIDMSTFGESDTTCNGEDVCYGCAATCALQKLSGVRFDASNINHPETRMSALPPGSVCDVEDLVEFEFAVDSARKGYLFALFAFFGIPDRLAIEYADRYDGRWWLASSMWRTYLPRVRETAEEMAAEGL